MTNDIVARLREIEAGYSMRSLLTEAADEIERLRTELRIEQEECSACTIDRKETQRERDEARKERDEIRRRYCLVGISDSDRNGHLFIARVNGWEGLFDDWKDGKDE